MTSRGMTSINHDERPPPSIADVLAACGAALVEATPAIDFIALCATSKRTAAVTDPTVLKALEEQLPVLGSEFVKNASRPRPSPAARLTSLAQQTGQRPRSNVRVDETRTCRRGLRHRETSTRRAAAGVCSAGSLLMSSLGFWCRGRPYLCET